MFTDNFKTQSHNLFCVLMMNLFNWFLNFGNTTTTTTTVVAGHAGSGLGSGGGSTVSQLRLAIREVAHVWSSMIHEMAMQIHVFQRVVAKKEDPTTHEKFIHVLQRLGNNSSNNINSGSYSTNYDETQNQSHGFVTNALLSKGLLLELFWHRLEVSLQDVASDKVKHFSVASSRAYPYIRKAAVEILQNLKNWTDNDMTRELNGIGAPFSLHSGNSSNNNNYALDDFSVLGSGNSAGTGDANIENADFDHSNDVVALDGGALIGAGLFGSLDWTQDDLLGTISTVNSVNAFRNRQAKLKANVNSSTGSRAGSSSGALVNSEGRANIVHKNRASWEDSADSSHKETKERDREHSLVLGLKPMRDKYLIVVLSRMSAPIAQMFPELDGYTGKCLLV